VANLHKFHSNDADNRIVMLLLRRHSALVALVTAGVLWGLTVPLSKLVLEWLPGGWLTLVRFAIAAPLLALVSRGGLRRAFTPRILAAGAVGYGLVVILQNAGIEATSVSHAALIVGAVPAIVALITVATGRGKASTLSWVGFALALAGVGIVAGGGGGGASLGGDALMLASVTVSATFVVVQAGLLRGQDPIAMTAVQMFAGALAAVPNALFEGLPPAPPSTGPVVALLALATIGTLAPFALFAYGQSRVAPELAGAFLNLEPLVGTAAGALAFGDPFGPLQLAGGAVILVGIALSTAPPKRRTPHPVGAGSRTPRRQPTRSRTRARGAKLRIKQHPSSLSPNMTLLVPRPDRTVAPHTYVVPVVRELPSSSRR
jgi:drug/metabolite transporter (DMT)-like permease